MGRRENKRPGQRPAPALGRFPQRGLGGEQVEGRRAVWELLRAERRKVIDVLVVEGVAPGSLLAAIVDLASESGIPVRTVDRARLESLAATEAHQGVIARAAPLEETDLSELIAATETPFLVVLDGITDPRNMGAVMRSAACAGATGLVIGRHRSAQITPAAVKTAAGAVEHLPVAVVPGIPTALGEMAAAGVWTVALDADGEEELWGLKLLSGPVALVLGAEGKGLSRLTRQRCDVVARIPMAGAIESLNVAAAGTLACFEVARARRQPM